MKLITLNLWGGIVYEPLLEFISKYSTDVDVFCFQEVLFGEVPEFTARKKGRVNIFNELSSVLTDFVAFKLVSESKHFVEDPVDFGVGQVIFVRKNVKVLDQGGFHCYDISPGNSTKGGKITGNLNWVGLDLPSGKLTIANVHGLWQEGTGKADTPERITQSEKIINFLTSKEGKQILCGDLNLAPDTESVKILSEGRMNLIEKYKVISTRNDFYDGPGKFADYMIVSPEVEVKDFKVLPDEVSDHLPLFLEFN